MTLIRSISGIRGTLGGPPGQGLTPSDIVRYTAAFAGLVTSRSGKEHPVVVVGRDARVSGPMVSRLVCGTLMGCGIIITASHNPAEWNALKLVNAGGEFLTVAEGEEVLRSADNHTMNFATAGSLGSYRRDETALDIHIRNILQMPLVDPEAIRKAGYSIAVDAVNSSGGVAVPRLLDALGVRTIHRVHCEPTGDFAHNPEPLPGNLTDLSGLVVRTKSDAGLAVDPDVDRLAILSERGEPIGEEYTLVTVADYVLQHHPGNSVSNLSSSMALKDITEQHGGAYYYSAVGEVNVVEQMKQRHAVIGGEGNGGVIYPPLHYGRDALAGIALFLSGLARSGKTVSAWRSGMPDYFISKNRIELDAQTDLDAAMTALAGRYKDRELITTDGVRINLDREWVHLRKSNTEPIIRIYAESDSPEKAERLVRQILSDFSEILHEH
jgi:phosphomannomutase